MDIPYQEKIQNSVVSYMYVKEAYIIDKPELKRIILIKQHFVNNFVPVMINIVFLGRKIKTKNYLSVHIKIFGNSVSISKAYTYK